MQQYATLSPAYGRDYKSDKDALTDFRIGWDFYYVDPGTLRDVPVNRSQVEEAGVTAVTFRYSKQRKVAGAVRKGDTWVLRR